MSGAELLQVAREATNLAGKKFCLRAFLKAHAAKDHTRIAVKARPAPENDERRVEVEVGELHGDCRENLSCIEEIDGGSKLRGSWRKLLCVVCHASTITCAVPACEARCRIWGGATAVEREPPRVLLWHDGKAQQNDERTTPPRQGGSACNTPLSTTSAKA